VDRDAPELVTTYVNARHQPHQRTYIDDHNKGVAHAPFVYKTWNPSMQYGRRPPPPSGPINVMYNTPNYATPNYAPPNYGPQNYQQHNYAPPNYPAVPSYVPSPPNSKYQMQPYEPRSIHLPNEERPLAGSKRFPPTVIK
jgi:hypothetical protein